MHVTNILADSAFPGGKVKTPRIEILVIWILPYFYFVLLLLHDPTPVSCY